MGSDREERKMVQRVKEILHDRPEQEIYAMLKECGMDPDEAVQRLLSQDTFHEVRSKRDRRKEMRETQDTRSRIGSGVSNGGWSIDRDDGRTTVQLNSNAPYKRENDSVTSSVSYPSSTTQSGGKPVSQQLSKDSDSFNAENRGQLTGTGSIVFSSSQPPTKSEPCGAVTGIGRSSIADIVWRGSLHNGSSVLAETSLHREDEEQESDAHGNSENFSSVGFSFASTGLLRAHRKDASDEQVSSNGDITCKTGSHGASAASDFHQVNYLGEPLPEQTKEEIGTVVLPSHVQALSADCSHLSFGTYNSKSSSKSGGVRLPTSSQLNAERLSMTGDGLSAQPLHNQLRRQQMVGAAIGEATIPVISDSASRGFQNSIHELMREPGYASSYRKEEIPQHYGDAAIGMQGNLLASSEQSFRTDSVPSTFLEASPLPLRYRSSASSFKSSAISLPETLMADTFHPFEPSSRTSVASHGIPHQLLDQAYSQQTNPLKQYAYLNNYKNIPESYGQIPLHQSLGSTKLGLPQFKRDDPARNFAMNGYSSSGFDSFQGANTFLGGFTPNSAVASSLSTVGYNNMLQNQIIQERNHFPPHGLGDVSSNGWSSGPGARAMSTAQEKAYYNMLLEKQLNLRHQQDQQFPRDYGSLGGFGSNHSQVGAAPESQLLHGFGDMTLNDRADPLLKQHQFWQQPRY
ncbi:uncharacterized protein LOC116196536 isoform X2 [Punica granatum]|uniref:Uncharacterized protein LOC116196536 isoform X2 n=1 Tax=Punica granatum TaxID=22663 RepID=A0A6P8CDV7_PUNGR|nr:uncharacterized protein LOC116196536 isoform X2 [Punica granatum]